MAGLQVIVIGSGPGGFAAALKVRHLDPAAKVTLISAEDIAYYYRPRLIDYLAGKIEEKELIAHPHAWYKEQKIEVILNTKIFQIDTIKRAIFLDKNSTLKYDKLILAVGADPFRPEIEGLDNENVFFLRDIVQAREIAEAAADVNSITMIGGGLLSLEVAGALCREGRTINILERSEHLLHNRLEVKQSQKLQRLLEERGFKFYLDDTCLNISKNNDQLVINTFHGQQIASDLIIVCVGVRQRTELAEQAGILTNKGIKVDRYLQTSDQNIYAVGDCIELDQHEWGWGFVKSAREQGELAAENIIKGNKREYHGSEIEIILKVSEIDLKSL